MLFNEEELTFEISKSVTKIAPFSEPAEGKGFPEPVGVAIIKMKYDFQIVGVKLDIEWNSEAKDDDLDRAYLQLTRGLKKKKKTKIRPPEYDAYIAEYDEKDSGFVIIDKTVGPGDDPDEDENFWKLGQKGELVKLFYHPGEEGCTLHFKKCNVSIIVKDVNKKETLQLSTTPSGKLIGHAFPEDTGITYTQVPYNFQLTAVIGHVKWTDHGSGDTGGVLKLKRVHFGANPVIFGTLVLAEYARKTDDGLPQVQKFHCKLDHKNVFWKKGKAGQSLASYYNVGGENKELTIHEVDIQLMLSPIHTGTAPRSLPGAVAAAAASSASAALPDLTEERSRSPTKASGRQRIPAFVALRRYVSSTGKVRAFVCGVSEYESLTPLKNAVHDAEAIRDLLKEHGAEVHFTINCNSFELYRVYGGFLAALQPGDMAIIFFAGHGCRYNNQQRLFCRALTRKESTRKGIQAAQNIKQRSLAVETMVVDLEAKRTKLNLFLLDCCRTFQYEDEARDTGEKIVMKEKKSFNFDPADGTCISFATQPDSYASDGKVLTKVPDTHMLNDGKGHGLYTAALKRHLATPDIDVDVMLRRVGREVEETSGGKQKPYRNNCINDEKAYLFISGY